MQPIEIKVVIDEQGVLKLNLNPPNLAPAAVIGFLEMAKGYFLNNMINPPKTPSILPASANDLEQINRIKSNGQN